MTTLDAYIKKNVKISLSTRTGIKEVEGIILSADIGRSVELDAGIFQPEGRMKSQIASGYPFAGWDVGIVRIEYEGKPIYENREIPNPYPRFRASNEEDLIKLNQLRKKLFGDGFEFN